MGDAKGIQYERYSLETVVVDLFNFIPERRREPGRMKRQRLGVLCNRVNMAELCRIKLPAPRVDFMDVAGLLKPCEGRSTVQQRHPWK